MRIPRTIAHQAPLFTFYISNISCPDLQLKSSPPWGLQVMESVVKNCGQTVHDEVANKQTMEELKDLLKVGALQGAERPVWGSTTPGASWGFAGTCVRNSAEGWRASVCDPCLERSGLPRS